MSPRRRRVVSLTLLAVLAWIPAQAAVCLGWCDDAFGTGQAAQQSSHVVEHAPAEAPCHGPSGASDASFTPVGHFGCDDVVRPTDDGVLPVKAPTGVAPAAAVVGVPATDDASGAHLSRTFALASDSGPPCPVPSRAPLVLRI